MGTCMSGQKQQVRRRQALDVFDQQPTDTYGLDPQSLPMLTFHALLTNVKIKRCSYKMLSMKINFGGYQEFELLQKFFEKQYAKWIVQHKFVFSMNEYEMRKRFLDISFIDSNKKVVGKLKINLYIIANGPYHQDFPINLENNREARISFNLKISQLVKMSVKIEEAQLIPRQKEYPGDRFAFTLRSIMGENVHESDISYTNIIAFDNITKRSSKESQNSPDVNRISNAKIKNIQSLEQIPLHIQRQTSTSNRNSNAKEVQKQVKIKEIKWTHNISSNMPSLELTVPLYVLHSGSLNLIFWELEQTQDIAKSQIQSECFVSLNKLLAYPCEVLPKNDQLIAYEDRSISIELKNWDQGKDVGVSKFKIRLLVQTHLKQMQICVRTEQGILQTSPVFVDSDGGHNTIEIQNLVKLTNQIQLMFIELAEMESMKSERSLINKKLYEISKAIRSQRDILMISTKESKLTFNYKNEEKLMKGQEVLIDLGFKIIHILHEDQQDLYQSCWSLLSTLIKRAELTLAHIGYSKSDKERCLKGENSIYINQKHTISFAYQQLMIQLLKITLKALNTYNSQSQKLFAQQFCAVAYFRIPVFRNQILNAITKADDPQIEEWRGTDFNLYENNQPNAESQSVFEIMFDWESNFYKMIQKDEKCLANRAKLMQILSESRWQERMAKRGGAYYAFVRYWVAYIEDIAVKTKYVTWKYFPGYNKILHSFLVQMKQKPISEYSDVMRKAAANMLSNQKLLNTFIVIIFKKTNVNDQAATMKTLDIINLFFESIKKRGRSIPTTFDFTHFMNGIKIILQSQSSFCLGKVLVILYDNFLLFPVNYRVELSMYFLTKVFFRSFLHWSANARAIFHHLLYIRIYHECSKPLTQMDAKDQQVFRIHPEYRTQITSRYNKNMMILQNAQALEGKIKKNVQNSMNDSNLYKKMKQKITNKRRSRNNSNQKANGTEATQSNKASKLKSIQQEQIEMMEQLSKPKLQRYNSELLNINLRVTLQNKQSEKKDEVRYLKNLKNSSNNIDQAIPQIDDQRRIRKISIFQSNPEYELTPLKQSEICYVSRSLEEYHKINEEFIKHIARNKESVPTVKLELSLDEKELRPQGLDLDIDEW